MARQNYVILIKQSVFSIQAFSRIENEINRRELKNRK